MNKNIAIIGAGISGLTLTSQLKEHANVTVFEKARGVGGRMSTRYTEQFEFDHGTQYFTVRDKHFQNFLKPFIDEGVIHEWRPRVLTLEKGKRTYKRDWFEPHFTASPRMNSLCKKIASECNVITGIEVASIEEINGQWKLTDKQGGNLGMFDWVISSAPVAQTINLLPKTFEHYQKLNPAKMTGCMSLMLGLAHDITLPFDAAVVKSSPIGWVANNSTKPNRNKVASLIVQTTAEWAEENIEHDLAWVEKTLIEEACELLDIKPQSIMHSALHRWRYADVGTAVGEQYLLDSAQKLAACGDWCLGGRVENAFLSGYHLAQALKEQL